MARTCAQHAEAEAVAACHQCRKPLCAACTLVTPSGRFCSPECSGLRRASAGGPAAGRRARASGLLLGLVLLATAASGLVLVHLVARSGRHPEGHWLKRIDVIGRFILQR